MSQCGASCVIQTGGGCPLKNQLQTGEKKKRRTKHRVRFTTYVNVYNSKSCKRRPHHKTHKKLPKNCKNVSK